MSSLTELKELADKATPGPWGAWIEGARHPFKAGVAWGGSPLVLVRTDTSTSSMIASEVTEEDARYIAACSPEVVKALVAVAEAAVDIEATSHGLGDDEGWYPIRVALDALKEVLK